MVFLFPILVYLLMSIRDKMEVQPIELLRLGELITPLLASL